MHAPTKACPDYSAFLMSGQDGLTARAFVWLLVTLHFKAQVNREAFYLSIQITVTVIEQSRTVSTRKL